MSHPPTPEKHKQIIAEMHARITALETELEEQRMKLAASLARIDEALKRKP